MRSAPEYLPHVFKNNIWLGANKREVQTDFSHGTLIGHLANWKYGYWGIHLFPAWLRGNRLQASDSGSECDPNLSRTAVRYLKRSGAAVEDLFHHVLATLHDPAYRRANAGAFRVEWPRIPLPGWPDAHQTGAKEELITSATRGRELARLLDPDTPVPGVTEGALRPELASLAVPATTDGSNMAGPDFAVTAGWGRFGSGDAVMPGTGRAVERDFGAPERSALADALPGTRPPHLRHLAKQPRPLAERTRRRLELPPRRLSGPEEVALLSRELGSQAGLSAPKRSNTSPTPPAGSPRSCSSRHLKSCDDTASRSQRTATRGLPSRHPAIADCLTVEESSMAS